MNEKMNKALAYFGRKDLTDGLYENDIDDNVQVFLTIRQMIKLYNLQSKIDRANDYIDSERKKIQQHQYSIGIRRLNKIKDILKEDK